MPMFQFKSLMNAKKLKNVLGLALISGGLGGGLIYRKHSAKEKSERSTEMCQPCQTQILKAPCSPDLSGMVKDRVVGLLRSWQRALVEAVTGKGNNPRGLVEASCVVHGACVHAEQVFKNHPLKQGSDRLDSCKQAATEMLKRFHQNKTVMLPILGQQNSTLISLNKREALLVVSQDESLIGKDNASCLAYNLDVNKVTQEALANILYETNCKESLIKVQGLVKGYSTSRLVTPSIKLVLDSQAPVKLPLSIQTQVLAHFWHRHRLTKLDMPYEIYIRLEGIDGILSLHSLAYMLQQSYYDLAKSNKKSEKCKNNKP